MKLSIRRISFLLTCLFVCVSEPVAASKIQWGYVAGSHVRTSTETSNFRGAEIELDVDMQWNLFQSIDLIAQVRARKIIGDSLSREWQTQEINRSHINRLHYFGDEFYLDLRDFYFNITLNDLFLRVGKQQVVWGQADAFKILDQLNPQSFREFILDDYSESRISLWSLLAEYRLGNLDMQFFWTPDTSRHEIPYYPDWFGWTTPRLVPQAPNNVTLLGIRSVSAEGNAIAADWGVQLSTFIGGWDISLNYAEKEPAIGAYHWAVQPGGVVLEIDYQQQKIFGFSAATAIRDFVIRTEATTRKGPVLVYATNMSQGTHSADQRNTLWLAGVDYSGFQETFISVQILSDRLNNTKYKTIRPRLETYTSAYIERRIADLKFGIEALHNWTEDDGYAKLFFSSELSDHFEWQVTYAYFYGEVEGIFGQFSEKNLFKLSLMYRS